VSNAQNDDLRAYYKRALEAAQARLDAHDGSDVSGRHDLSKQVQRLWNAYASHGGNWRDLEHVKKAMHHQRVLQHARRAKAKAK
jgi:hypothetical protein